MMSYSDKKLLRLTAYTFIWIILLIASLALLSGCATQAQIAARKAAIEQERQRKEALKKENERQAEIIKLLQTRKALPCDSSRVVPGKTIYIAGEKIPCPQGKDSAQCPPCKSRTSDTVYIADPVLIAIVRDSANSAAYWQKRYQDSTNKIIANLTHDNAIYKKGSDKWDRLVNWLLVILGGASAIGLILGFFKMKSKIGL